MLNMLRRLIILVQLYSTQDLYSALSPKPNKIPLVQQVSCRFQQEIRTISVSSLTSSVLAITSDINI